MVSSGFLWRVWDLAPVWDPCDTPTCVVPVERNLGTRRAYIYASVFYISVICGQTIMTAEADLRKKDDLCVKTRRALNDVS